MEPLFALLFIPVFILLWIAVTSLIAVIGGWYNLSKSFPVPRTLQEKGVSYSFQSIRIGFFGNYNSSVNITVYTQGMRVAPLFIYSALHKPIYIEFKSISDASFGKLFFVHYVSFNLGDKKIKIWGKSAPAVKEKMHTAGYDPVMRTS